MTDLDTATRPTVGQRLAGWLRFLVWTAVLTALLVLVLGSLRGGVAVEGQAPDFTAQALDGSTVRLADLRGKPVVLYFWASWCTACKLTSPTVSWFASRHPDVRVLGIAMEEADAARAYLRDHPRDFATVPVDEALDAAWKVRALPTTVMLDADGKVRWSRQGVLLPFELEWHLP